MLIYVNQIRMIGEKSSDIAFRTIAGWLKNVTKRHFTISELKSGEDFSINRTHVRTYTATDDLPFMYSVLLSHPDHSVKGRQWITEIGIREDNGFTTVSILLETSDISTLVTDIPSTTKPRLVNFLQTNGELHPETVGLKLQKFENNRDSLIGLSYEIERKERKYPLVLVSNVKETNKPVINPDKLQEQLLGLAQVVYSENEVNSWEMESILTREYSAWDGAVNIIYPAFDKDFCHTKLFSKYVLNDIIESGDNINQSILSYITHTTNGFNKKKHFSPSDVRAKRQKDLRFILKKRFGELSEAREYQELAEMAFSQLEEQENLVEQLRLKHEQEIDEQLISVIKANDEVDTLTSEKLVLEMRIKELQRQTTKEGNPILVYGVEREFYSGEISDLILSVIKQKLENEKANTRKQQILQDVVKHNEIDGTRESYITTIKSIFSGYCGVTPKIKTELKKLNMEVIEDVLICT